MTASSPDAAPGRTRPVGAWVSVVLFTLLGLAVLTAPWWAYGTRPGATPTTGLVLFGLAVLTVPLCTWSLRLRDPTNRVVTSGDALQIRLDNQLVSAVAVLSLTWTLFLVWGAVSTGIAGAGLLVLLLALPFAALLPDTIRALSRRATLTLSVDRVTYQGWSREAELSWDDLASVQLAAPHVRRPVIRLQARAGASSYRDRSRKLLVSLDLAPGTAAIDVPLLAVASPGRLMALVETLARSTPDQRRTLLSETGPHFLASGSSA